MRKAKSDKLLLTLVAEIQAISVALKRVGERMAARGSSDAVHAEVLIQFFLENNVAASIDSIYLNAIKQIETDGDFTEKDLDFVDALCGKKLKQRYGITF